MKATPHISKNMGKFTNYDTSEQSGLIVEDVRTVVNPEFGDFPLELFPNFWRSPFGSPNQRLYARKGHPEFFSGISSLASACGLTDKSGLNKARVTMAFQGLDADIKWNERANYGSCLHLLIALHERNELKFVFGLHDWTEVVEDFITSYGYHSLREQWYADIQNDMAAYFSFKRDSNVKIVTTEVMVCHDDWHIATPLDIVAQMDFGGKRIFANINIKTGDTHPFSEDYFIQTCLEAYLYNRQIEKNGKKNKYSLNGSFCWRPKTRSKTPGNYELSKNTINLYTEDDFLYIAEYVKRKKPYVPSSDSKIVTFHGNEENSKIIIRTPYEWLKNMNGDAW